jgi:hypothetical protein
MIRASGLDFGTWDRTNDYQQLIAPDKHRSIYRHDEAPSISALVRRLRLRRSVITGANDEGRDSQKGGAEGSGIHSGGKVEDEEPTGNGERLVLV